MNQEKFSKAALAKMQDKASKVESYIVRSKPATALEAEARPLFEALMNERLATRRSELLMHAQKRYGKGAEFGRNLQESRQTANARMAAKAPQAQTLWLADAVVATGARKDIEDLSSDPEVESIDLNRMYRMPEILQTPLEDSPRAIDGSTWGVHKICAPQVWSFGRGAGVRVGHLDTGVDATHPALANQVAGFQEFDLLGNPVASAPHDSHIHGTHTAGTILGRNFNGTNIGVAPDAKLYSALVLNGGAGSFAQIVAGMQWCLTQNVHVMNLSLGGQGYTPLWNLPVLISTLLGTLVVASIGNSGHGASGGPGNDLFSLGVGATHNEDVVAGFSGGQTLVSVPHVLFGNLTYMKPDVSAPGVQVISCIPNNGIASLNGTSMAAPHITGAAALIMSAVSGLQGQPLAVRSILLGTIEDFGEAGRDQRFGFGRIDALASMQTAVSIVQ
jgi:subtilisin family serine protease